MFDIRLASGTASATPLALYFGESAEQVPALPLRPLAGSPEAEYWHGLAGDASASHQLLWQRLAGDEPPAEAGHRLYAGLLARARERGLEPARFWNALPAIHDPDTATGLERYQAFSVGRERAFRNAGIRHYPAASAVGCRARDGAVLCLATAARCRHFENPRQWSAFTYPRRYGPASPSFARATFVGDPPHGDLLVSGTASIVGHETRHPGDTAAQLEETITNLRALLNHVNERLGCALTLSPATARLRVYLRCADELALVHRVLDEGLQPAPPALIVQADICRRELGVEIEAVVHADERGH